MLNRFTIRRRWLGPAGRRLSLLFGGVVVACASPVARAYMISAAASATPDCSVSGGGWECYLPGIFRFLLVIAIVLGLVLVGVIAVAVKSYLKLKHEQKVDS